jgi:hypothetical protein
MVFFVISKNFFIDFSRFPSFLCADASCKNPGSSDYIYLDVTWSIDRLLLIHLHSIPNWLENGHPPNLLNKVDFRRILRIAVEIGESDLFLGVTFCYFSTT